MSFARIQETFMRLPRRVKLIGIGAVILGVSTFCPWYEDLDSYRIGDQFLGITGPASFVGIVILLLSGFSLWMFSYHLFEKRLPKLPVKEAIINLFVAIESLFLLVLVNSIYFHPKFGVNITLKESRFGMTFAFAGAVVLLVGAFLQNREDSARDRELGKLEPLIKMEPQGAFVPKSEVAAEQARTHGDIAPKKDPQKNFLFGERGLGERPAITKMMQQMHATTHTAPAGSPKAEEKKETPKAADGNGSYMIRMDL